MIDGTMFYKTIVSALGSFVLAVASQMNITKIMGSYSLIKHESFRPVKGQICNQRTQKIRRFLSQPKKANPYGNTPCNWLKIGQDNMRPKR